jgi:hypothetical protein
MRRGIVHGEMADWSVCQVSQRAGMEIEERKVWC